MTSCSEGISFLFSSHFLLMPLALMTKFTMSSFSYSAFLISSTNSSPRLWQQFSSISFFEVTSCNSIFKMSLCLSTSSFTFNFFWSFRYTLYLCLEAFTSFHVFILHVIYNELSGDDWILIEQIFILYFLISIRLTWLPLQISKFYLWIYAKFCRKIMMILVNIMPIVVKYYAILILFEFLFSWRYYKAWQVEREVGEGSLQA